MVRREMNDTPVASNGISEAEETSNKTRSDPPGRHRMAVFLSVSLTPSTRARNLAEPRHDYTKLFLLWQHEPKDSRRPGRG